MTHEHYKSTIWPLHKDILA